MRLSIRRDDEFVVNDENGVPLFIFLGERGELPGILEQINADRARLEYLMDELEATEKHENRI